MWVASLRGDEHVEVVNALVEAKASVDCTDDKGRTALYLAASECSTTVVKVLVGLKANLNNCDNCGNSALSIALSRDDLSTVQVLVNAGADVTKVIRDTTSDQTKISKLIDILHWSREGQPDCDVCLEPINVTDIRKLSCGHFFHKSCMDRW
jgi:ankyrin repeat protein